MEATRPDIGSLGNLPESGLPKSGPVTVGQVLALPNLKGIIFDVDGTLYDLDALRPAMALRLAAHFGPRPWRWGELAVIQRYRRALNGSEGPVSMEEQLALAVRGSSIAPDRLKALVDEWMQRRPLDIIRAHPRAAVLDLLGRARERGMVLAAYSDYPAAEKLQALGVEADHVLDPLAPGIMERKPSRHDMGTVLDAMGLAAPEVVYLGDGESTDAASAALRGIAFVHVDRLTE